MWIVESPDVRVSFPSLNEEENDHPGDNKLSVGDDGCPDIKVEDLSSHDDYAGNSPESEQGSSSICLPLKEECCPADNERERLCPTITAADPLHDDGHLGSLSKGLPIKRECLTCDENAVASASTHASTHEKLSSVIKVEDVTLDEPVCVDITAETDRNEPPACKKTKIVGRFSTVHDANSKTNETGETESPSHEMRDSPLPNTQNPRDVISKPSKGKQKISGKAEPPSYKKMDLEDPPSVILNEANVLPNTFNATEIGAFVLLCESVLPGREEIYYYGGFPPAVRTPDHGHEAIENENTLSVQFGPEYDAVVILQQTPFSSWQKVNKCELLREGRPTPNINWEETKSQKGRSRSKISFQQNWYSLFKWLCGSRILKRLFCWPCLLFSHHRGAWIMYPATDVNNFITSAKLHQATKEHIRCALTLQRETAHAAPEPSNPESSFSKIFNERVRLNRLVMQHFVDVVLFMAKGCIPFRGHNEKKHFQSKGHFEEFFSLLMKRAAGEVRCQYESIKPAFSASYLITVQNDIVDSIATYLKNKIRDEIDKCDYFSVEVSDVSDLVNKSQCAVIVHFVDRKGVIQERFLGLFDVSVERESDSLFQMVSSALRSFDISKKLVGQAYDGGSLKVGRVSDLKARMMTVAPQAVFTHCSYHHLTSVCEKGCATRENFRDYFQTLDSMSVFFLKLAERCENYDRIVGDKIPGMAPPHWRSRPEMVSLVFKHWRPLKSVFEEICRDETLFTLPLVSQGCLRSMNSFKFAFLTAVFYNIFEIVNTLHKKIQTKPLDVSLCSEHIQLAEVRLRAVRKNEWFGELLRWAAQKTSPTSTSSNPSLDEIRLEYKRLYFEAIDAVRRQLTDRFRDLPKLNFISLADTSQACSFDKSFPVDNFKSLVYNFPSILNHDYFHQIRNELAAIYSDKELSHMAFPDLLRKLNDELKDVLPQAYKVFTLIATLPVTSISNGKSAPLLERVQHYLRTTTWDQWSNSLSLISIEKEVLDFHAQNDDSFYNTIIDIYASMKDRRIDLFRKS